jgi:hypothetical protein
MAENGVKTTSLPGAATVDSVLGNRDGNTVRQSIGNLGVQLVGTGAVASALDTLRGQITSGLLVRATWAELLALDGGADGTGAEVPPTDTGTHQDATATGYTGGVVTNTGRYSWNAARSRWDWIAEAVRKPIDQKIALRHRPGDVPERFNLGNAMVVADAYGQAIRIAFPLRVSTVSMVPMEAGALLELLVSYYRTRNSEDPANDGVQVGIEYFDANRSYISSVTLATDVTLTSAQGRKVVARAIAHEPVLGSDAVAPAGTVYARVWIEFFGVNHVTDCDVLMLDRQPQAVAVPAPNVIIPSGFQWPEETIPDFPVARTIYVSQGGSDANNGESLRRAVRSIEAARDLVEASGDPTSIVVYPGRYETSGHIDVPDNCTEIVGIMGQRSAVVVPTAGNAEKNVFRGGSGFMLRSMSAQGFQVDDFDNPTEGFLMSFRPGAVIYRALYMDHCVNYRAMPPSLIPPPLDPLNGNPDMPKGPGLVLADSAVVSGYSPFAQIMVEASTNSAPNGVGCVVKGEAYINLINAVLLWSHKHVMSFEGGLVQLDNCSTQMGDYTFWAEGSTNQIRLAENNALLGQHRSAAGVVAANKSAIVAAAVAAAPGSNPVNTARDAGFLVDAIAADLIGGTKESLDMFVRGLFPKGVFVAPSAAPFVSSFNAMRAAINALAISQGAKDAVTVLINTLNATVQNPTFTKRPSLIEAHGTRFQRPFSGVNRRAFYRPLRAVQDSIVERNLGVVQFSGVDGRGEQFFSGGASVEPVSGQFKGPPVARTIQPFAIRAALIAGGQQ